MSLLFPTGTRESHYRDLKEEQEGESEVIICNLKFKSQKESSATDFENNKNFWPLGGSCTLVD